MNPQIEKLSRMLNLSPYQSQTLVGGSDKYNMSRLVKRGGLLYAPYNMRGVFGRASRNKILCGRISLCSNWPLYVLCGFDWCGNITPRIFARYKYV